MSRENNIITSTHQLYCSTADTFSWTCFHYSYVLIFNLSYLKYNLSREKDIAQSQESMLVCIRCWFNSWCHVVSSRHCLVWSWWTPPALEVSSNSTFLDLITETFSLEWPRSTGMRLTPGYAWDALPKYISSIEFQRCDFALQQLICLIISTTKVPVSSYSPKDTLLSNSSYNIPFPLWLS